MMVYCIIYGVKYHISCYITKTIFYHKMQAFCITKKLPRGELKQHEYFRDMNFDPWAAHYGNTVGFLSRKGGSFLVVPIHNLKILC